MKRATLGIIGICLLVSAACGRSEDRPALEEPATVRENGAAGPPRTVNVEGCLTASGDRFVLTQLESTDVTPAYRLVGMDEQLRSLVGQQVEVTGTAAPEQVVDIRESTPPAATGDDGARGTSGTEPQVSTTQTTQLEVSDLRVSAIKATGEPCVAR